jgi:hypothetical protein
MKEFIFAVVIIGLTLGAAWIIGSDLTSELRSAALVTFSK